MFFDITEAQYAGDYMIKLHFEDGSSGAVDLSKYPNKENVFRAFLDKEYFRNFRIEHGTLVWGNGELDIAPETLYTNATGKPVRYHAKENQGV